MLEPKLIESDRFPFEFLSVLAKRESWRKEVHRPIYHVHKWWAKRLGSVFRGLALGCVLDEDEDLSTAFYPRVSPFFRRCRFTSGSAKPLPYFMERIFLTTLIVSGLFKNRLEARFSKSEKHVAETNTLFM